MKKILSAIILLSLIFTLCGCQEEKIADSQKQPVVINLPKDNTVNGYRIDEKTQNSIPDKIDASEVFPNISENSNNSTTSQNTNISYCGNKNSKKFHKSTCGALKNTKAENKVYFETREEFIQNGYTACKLCHP